MPETGQLDILIKLMADTTGATLTADQIETVKQNLNELGVSGEEAFDRNEKAAGNFSFRTQHHAQVAILAMTGLQGPLANIVYHFEYIQMMADRMGVSVQAMLTQFAPLITIGVAAGVLGKAFSFIGQEGKDALEAAGRASGGMVDNFAAGLQALQLLNSKLEKTDDIAKNIDEHFKLLGDQFDETLAKLRAVTEAEQLAVERRAIEKQTSRTEGYYKQMGETIEEQKKAQTTMKFVVTPEGVKMYEQAAASPAGKAWQETTGKEIDQNSFAYLQGTIAAFYDDLIRQNTSKMHEFEAKQTALLKQNADRTISVVISEEARKAADEKAAWDKRQDEVYEHEAEKRKKDELAGYEAIAQDTTLPDQKRIKAEYAAIALRAQDKDVGPGERAKLNLEYEKFVQGIDTKNDAAANKQFAEQDRLAREAQRQAVKEQTAQIARADQALREAQADYHHQVLGTLKGQHQETKKNTADIADVRRQIENHR